MQTIDRKKHENILNAIEKFETYAPLFADSIAGDHDEIIRNNIADFKNTYANYQQLLKDLEKCISDYNTIHKALQQMVYPYVRKLSKEYQRKNEI